MKVFLPLLFVFIGACASTSMPQTVSTDNNDVLILSLLIQDHLRTVNERSVSLTELLKKDSLSRISNSFETVELKFKGGHISVYYNFSQSRDSKGIILSDQEKELTGHFRWAEKDLKSQYDGEIRLDYGERFYRVIKIIAGRRTS